MFVPKKCWVRLLPLTKVWPRSFDPMSDQHPVQWLVDNLKPALFNPMNDWFAEVLGQQPLQPSDVMMPDRTVIKKYVWLSISLLFINHPQDFLGLPRTMGQEQTTAALSLDVPILAFSPKIPSDGLPCLADWLGNALSIWSIGYEAFREGLEVKPVNSFHGGQPLAFGCLEAAKGTGRISILLFTMTYTFLKLKNSLSVEELDEFKVPPEGKNLQKYWILNLGRWPI